MPRRDEADPVALQAVSRRLARLLAETPARAEDVPDPPAHAAAPGRAAPDAGLADLDEVPPPRRFTRTHLGVVALLLLVGLLWGGWSVLRARPVALASPVTVTASASTAAGTEVPAAPAAPSPTAGTAGPTDSPAPAASVVVHVLGAVRSPGLVRLPAPARVQDALAAAGGLTRSADPGELNLAQQLQDGQQVVVGTTSKPAGEVRSTGPAGGGAASTGAPPRGGAAGGGALVDLNSAGGTELEELPGVGPVTAGKIVAWREQHGRFRRVEELQEVDGIGPKTYAEIAPHVRV